MKETRERYLELRIVRFYSRFAVTRKLFEASLESYQTTYLLN